MEKILPGDIVLVARFFGGKYEAKVLNTSYRYDLAGGRHLSEILVQPVNGWWKRPRWVTGDLFCGVIMSEEDARKERENSELEKMLSE